VEVALWATGPWVKFVLSAVFRNQVFRDFHLEDTFSYPCQEGSMKKVLVTSAALFVLACGGGDSTAPGVASAAGSWSLQTINGTPLPFTIFDQVSPPDKLEVLSNTFVASTSGTFVETSTLRETQGTTVTTQTETDTGTWRQNNAAITITTSDGTVNTAAISGDVITASESGALFVYHRQ
jgi:hypothetical protein